MKTTLFGKDNQSNSNERLHKEIIATYKALGLLPVLEELFEKTEHEAAALKKKLVEQGIPLSEAKAIAEATKKETQAKIILDIRDKYTKGLQKESSAKNYFPGSV